MTAPITTPSDSPDAHRYRALELLHGHRCPMSILGARLGWAARAALGVGEPGDRELSARYHHTTCAVDGIQVATQCTPGNGSLEVVDEGRHLLRLHSRSGGGTAWARLSETALEKGRRFNRLREEQETLAPDDPRREAMGRQMEEILRSLESGPQEELLLLRLEQA